jgi:DNA sulfur modification protein DndE
MRAHITLLAGVLLAITQPVPVITIHMAGDSTMADRPTPERNPYRGWGQLLSRFVDDSVVVRNHAVNGRSTKSFIDEGKWAALMAEVHRGDYVIIQFGHNDEKREDTTRYTDPNGAFRANLRRFVTDVRAAGATPILCTSIARRAFDSTGVLRMTHGEYPRATREVAAEMGVTLVDMEQSTMALVSSAGPDSSKRLFGWVAPGTSAMYPEGLHDDTHLSIEGATAVARLAARAIRDSGLPLATHIREDR